jgi:sulfur-oxidizing protein SoxB
MEHLMLSARVVTIFLVSIALITSDHLLAAETRLTFIHLNDLHANLVPHRDLIRKVDADGTVGTVIESRGGMARIATAIKKIRSESPNSILMNIGDTYHGGVEALYTRGNAIAAPVDALEIDIGVPGNWDFAYGPITTRLRYDSDNSWFSSVVNWLIFNGQVATPDYPVVAGNVRKTFWLFAEDDPLLPATHVMAVGDVKIGFIGITSDIVPRMSALLGWGFTFLQGETAYRELIDDQTSQLREQGVDLVVVMSELGLHRDRQLANVIEPGVDVFFSAHTHELTPVPLNSASGALVVESGNDSYLGKMTVTLSSGKPVYFDWEILPINDQIPEDPEMNALVETARAPFLENVVNFSYPMPNIKLPLTEPIDTVIASAPTTLHRRNALINPFNRYLADQMRFQYSADLALTPGFRFDAVVPAGEDITLEDLYRYLPVPPVLSRGEINGRALKQVLETELTRVFSQDAFEHSGGWFMGISGINLTLDLSSRDGHRVLGMHRIRDGSAIKAEDVLVVVSCARPFDDPGVLCSNEGFEAVEELESPWEGSWTPLELVRYALEHNLNPQREATVIVDQSHTQLWPQSSYIQPLQ